MVRQKTSNLTTMVDYWQRISDALKHAGVTQKQLQEHLGISYQAMKKLEDGKTKSLSAENNARAARFLGINSHWLATSEESMLQSGRASNVTYRHQERMAAQHVGESSTPFSSTVWPFIHIKPEQYALLSERQKGIIEGFALNMLKEQTDVKSSSTRAA